MMNVNPMALMQLKQRFDTFNSEHPRVIPFFKAVSAASIVPGTVFDMKVTTPDGNEMHCNIKLTENDIETFHQIMELGRNSQ
ncbi:hypothetical protein [Butyrivibrio sp. NC2002]|uniref:hypothetical protein n=1 Tax=Butyrivibrio sp. NC2002 TaxID=1410610 RepID=UPI00068A39C8|nr:hypothetical protein [Butyrivibrio sp. NC2002]